MFQVSTRRFCSLRAFAPAALLLSGLAWVTTGCANMATTATETSGLGAAKGVMSGQVHGGNQAVIGADVRLYAAGTTGYGSSPTLYAETSTDSLGNFSFTKSGTGVQSGATTPTYGCPASGDPQMYIQALGGNTQGAGNPVNTAAGFVIAIGTCSTIGAQTFVAMNELTTVATLAALQQYFSPANANTDNINHFGLPSTTQAQAAFANSVALIPNMVSTTRGTVNTGSTVSATPTGATAPVSVTITPEVSKIDTIANIAAACVNSYPTTSGATVTQSTACTTLFSNAVPPNPGVTSQGALTLSTATDTMQAVYYMLTNPTDGGVAALKNLFALSSAQGTVPAVLLHRADGLDCRHSLLEHQHLRDRHGELPRLRLPPCGGRGGRPLCGFGMRPAATCLS